MSRDPLTRWKWETPPTPCCKRDFRSGTGLFCAHQLSYLHAVCHANFFTIPTLVQGFHWYWHLMPDISDILVQGWES